MKPCGRAKQGLSLLRPGPPSSQPALLCCQHQRARIKWSYGLKSASSNASPESRCILDSQIENSSFSRSSIMLSFFPSPLASLQVASSCSGARCKKQKYRSSLQLPAVLCATLKHLHLKLLQVLINSKILHTRAPNRCHRKFRTSSAVGHLTPFSKSNQNIQITPPKLLL